MLKNFKLFTTVLFSFLGLYLFEFYIQPNNANIHFWYVQTLNNFNFGPLKSVSLPIHCDEGPYRIALTDTNTQLSQEQVKDFLSQLMY